MRMAAAENAVAAPITLPDDASAEDIFMAATPLAKRRLRGQFFTPAPIAKLMAEWVCEIAPARVLDPAVGTGMLVRAVAAACPAPVSFTAFEIDPLAADLARAHGPAQMDVRTADFLQDVRRESFDAVIANPPYVRHHDAAYTGDVMGALSKRTGITFSRLSNIYVPFIVKFRRWTENFFTQVRCTARSDLLFPCRDVFWRQPVDRLHSADGKARAGGRRCARLVCGRRGERFIPGRS